MIVCICRAKNERDVARAIGEGAASLRDLQQCGIGTDCGSCHVSLRQMLATSAGSDAALSAPPNSLARPATATAPA